MNRCETCKHWEKAELSVVLNPGNGYVRSLVQESAEAAEIYGNPSAEDGLKKLNEVEARIGECHAPRLHFYAVPSEGEAAVMDGSQYSASLVTTRTFGYTLWEGKNA